MNSWNQTSIGEFVNFNPPEKITKGMKSRKIPMDQLGVFQRKINGSEISEYSAGPKFRNGDTLVAKITPCLENGKTAFVDILDENEVAFGSSEFIVLRENELSDKEFIYYLARSPLFREKAISCMEGTSGRKRVNEAALKRQEILVPEKRVQKQIVSVLSALDHKIELNNRINDNLEQMAKAIYDYWFVQFDFPNSKGEPYKSSGGKMVYNDIVKREIPKDWEVKNLLNISDLFGGGTPSTTKKDYWNGKIPFFTPSDANESIFSINTIQSTTEKGVEESSTKIFEKGTIFLTARGSVGKVMIASKTMAMNQSCYALKSKDEQYIFLYFCTVNAIGYLKAKSSGSIFNAIVSNDIKYTPIIIPDKDLRKQFNQNISYYFERILNNLEQSQKLASIRDWLLPMLMNGQVTVK